MKIIVHQNIASSIITATTTATALFSLMNTAGSVTNSQAFYLKPSNLAGIASGLIITPEDGDIRLGIGGLTPTANAGMLLSSGTKYIIPNIDLAQLSLIRTSGDVICSIDLFHSQSGDAFAAVAEAVTLEVGSVTIGDVGIISIGGVATPVEDAAVTSTGIHPLWESKVMDGSALPNQTNEGDAARPAVTLAGIPFTFPTNLAGTGTPAIDHNAVIQNGLGLTTLMQGVEAKTVDGSALPNAVAEGDAVRPAASLNGVVLNSLANLDGSATAVAKHDAAIASGIATAGVIQAAESKTFDGSALPNSVSAEADVVRRAASLNGVGYTMITDQDGSDTPIVAESAAISAANGGTIGFMQMMEAVSAQVAAITSGDAGRPVLNLNKEQVVAGHTWATNSNRAEEIDPVDEHYVEEELIDDTNITGSGTIYYPSSTGKALGNFNNVSVHIQTSGGVTTTIEAKIDDSTDWIDISKMGVDLNTGISGNASWVDKNTIVDFDNLHVRHIRIASATSDETNGVQYHWKLVAL